MASGLYSTCLLFCTSTSFNTPRQVVSALPACSFTPQQRLMHHIVCAFRLVEAQSNCTSIRQTTYHGVYVGRLKGYVFAHKFIDMQI
jgi:hypothetical protein